MEIARALAREPKYLLLDEPFTGKEHLLRSIPGEPFDFTPPVHAQLRHPLIEERLVKLAAYSETFPLNQIYWQGKHLGIVTSGISYQYAREIFPEAGLLHCQACP
jgi:hypothetical protein